MSDFNNIQITDAGIEALSKAVAEKKQIQFVKIQSSDKKYTNEQLRALTSFTHKQERSVEAVRFITPNQVELTSVFDNSDVENGYEFASFVIYANFENKDFIFAGASNSADKSDWISAGGSLNSMTMNLKAIILMSSELVSTVTIAKEGISEDVFYAHVENESAHGAVSSAIPKKIISRDSNGHAELLFDLDTATDNQIINKIGAEQLITKLINEKGVKQDVVINAYKANTIYNEGEFVSYEQGGQIHFYKVIKNVSNVTPVNDASKEYYTELILSNIQVDLDVHGYGKEVVAGVQIEDAIQEGGFTNFIKVECDLGDVIAKAHMTRATEKMVYGKDDWFNSLPLPFWGPFMNTWQKIPIFSPVEWKRYDGTICYSQPYIPINGLGTQLNMLSKIDTDMRRIMTEAIPEYIADYKNNKFTAPYVGSNGELNAYAVEYSADKLLPCTAYELLMKIIPYFDAYSWQGYNGQIYSLANHPYLWLKNWVKLTRDVELYETPYRKSFTGQLSEQGSRYSQDYISYCNFLYDYGLNWRTQEDFINWFNHGSDGVKGFRPDFLEPISMEEFNMIYPTYYYGSVTTAWGGFSPFGFASLAEG